MIKITFKLEYSKETLNIQSKILITTIPTLKKNDANYTFFQISWNQVEIDGLGDDYYYLNSFKSIIRLKGQYIINEDSEKDLSLYTLSLATDSTVFLKNIVIVNIDINGDLGNSSLLKALFFKLLQGVLTSNLKLFK